MDTRNSFGYWIRRQRKALDLTQQALADRVGCSLAAIKKIEGDERKLSRQIAERLADVLGVSDSQREIFVECARGLFAIERDSEFDLAVYGSSVAELQEFYDELEAYDESPVDEAVEARAKELDNRVEDIMQAAGDGAEVAYHERARLTRLNPIIRQVV